MEVWDTLGLGFGDVWASLHSLLRLSESQRAPVYLTRWCDGAHDNHARLSEMLALIDTGGKASIEIVSAFANRRTHHEVWAARYFPTRMRWAPKRSGIVTYQFDGRSSAHLKNPSPEEAKAFLCWCVDLGLQPVPVGEHLPMVECARLMAMAEGHIGVCSGMATLAHSVGVPTYILEYGIEVAWWHGSNPITVCCGVSDLKARFMRIA